MENNVLKIIAQTNAILIDNKPFFTCTVHFFKTFTHQPFNMGKGHYYENQNIENQKEHRKNCKASEHRKCLLS